MEEKKVSSGAEKVENTEKKNINKTKGTVKQERKTKAMELREQRKENAAKRKAERLEKAAQRREERKKRAEMLRHETKAQRMKRKERERKERIALAEKRRAEAKERALKNKELRLKKKEARLAARKERRQRHAPGYGGWLAATITLGVTTLVLGSVVTAEAIEMTKQRSVAGAGYRSTFYELVGLMDEMETDLSKLRVANSTSEVRQLATDLYVQSSLAEGALERFPVSVQNCASMTSYINSTRDLSGEILASLGRGNGLSAEQAQEIDALYEKQSALKSKMNVLANEMTDADFKCLLKGGDGKFSQLFASLDEKKNEVVQATVSLGEKISTGEGEELVRRYFADYNIKTVEQTGEAVSDSIACYNYSLTDTRGREIFAQISKEGGKLIFFDSYEKCEAKNFNIEKCEEIAEDFLESIGIDEVESVFVSESGTTVDFTFVAEQNDVLLYPDTVKVKVCETKGKVIGMEAADYYASHRARKIGKPTISKARAIEEVGDKMKVTATNLAIIPLRGEEVLCYECEGKRGNKSYLVYVDAKTGEEVAIYTVVESKQGMFLK